MAEKAKNTGKNNPGLKKVRVKAPEKRWREDICYDYNLWGYTLHEISLIVNHGGQSGDDERFRWDISTTQIGNYIRAAQKRKAEEQSPETKEELLKEAKERWKSIIKTAKQAGNIENVRLCQKELDRLNGLEQINISVKVSDLRTKTDEELLEELNLLNHDKRE